MKYSLKPYQAEYYRVAVVQWTEHDGIAEVIADELESLGHSPVFFRYGSAIPDEVDVVFTFAPYGKLMRIIGQLANIRGRQRPLLVHWNTEGIPDPRLPWPFVSTISSIRSWGGRLSDLYVPRLRPLMTREPLSRMQTRMLRYRYVGDYHYAYRKGWLTVLADSSEIYARFHSRHGVPTIVAPWGATRRWYTDLGIERDIDVLWMGKRGTKRRSNLIDRVRRELDRRGIQMYVADDVENPFIFGDERTSFLNRTKIVLNITRTWYDDNFSRLALAVPNRALVVSEPLLPHCTAYKPGVHYVSAPVEMLADRIQYFLEHEKERQRIVANAYQLVTQVIPFRNSVETIMNAVGEARASLAFGKMFRGAYV